MYPVVTYRAVWDEDSPESSVLGGSWYQHMQYLKQDLREREELREWPIAEKITAIAYASGTLDIDLALGNIFKVTLGANVSAMTISNVPANTHEASFRLYVIQDGTGGRTMSWPASVRDPWETAPTPSTTLSTMTMYQFTSIDGGTIWNRQMAMTAVPIS